MINDPTTPDPTSGITAAQRIMADAHGTPAEFERACLAAVPGDVSFVEADAAVQKYRAQWAAAGGERPAVEYETEYEPLITCPYCGHKDRDSWESAGQFDGDERTIECGYCEHSFKMTTHIALTFSTEKIEP